MDNQKVPRYNLEVLKRIFSDIKPQQATEKKLAEPESKPNNDLAENWRFAQYLDHTKDVMVIASYGDEMFQGAVVVRKPQDNSTSEGKSELELARQELDILQGLYWKNKTHSMAYVCTDFPGAQFSKQYYIDKIKLLFSLCNQGAVLFYTGHGEKDTGNWCFKDGVITFDEIFGLYLDVMRGKPLRIVSDCSSAGKWAEYCAAKLDEIGILSCGHHIREQGILLKVFVSCENNQQATIGAYAKIMASLNENENIHLYYPGSKESTEYQVPWYVDSIVIRCNRKHGEQCQVVSADNTWMDRLFHGHLVYCVRGKDRGKPAWHYVLVDKEKEAAFKEKVKTGSVDVAEYGKVLKSGWGEDPPQSVKNMISQRFSYYLPEED